MLNVLTTTKQVVDQAQDVELNHDAIVAFLKQVESEELQTTDVNLAQRDWPLNQLIPLIFVFNTINFCFWAKQSQTKWTVNVFGEELDGATALFSCLEKELESNPKMVSGKYLANLTQEKLARILAGNVEIPLLEQRLQCLREAGQVLAEQFGGSFFNVWLKGKKDALQLVSLLVDNFPHFNDVSEYHGEKVAFYKRAQLNSKMIHDTLISQGKQGLTNLDQLTAFADYKIPQMLRKLSVVSYSLSLVRKIDSYQLIEPNSAAEIEIRAASIWGVELIRQELRKQHDFVTAAHVDSLLWTRSQKKFKDDKPYHRTETIYY